MSNKAFTLVETLSVTGIIMVLAGLTFALSAPALRRGQEVDSLHRMKQIGLAGAMYNEEYGSFPRSVRILVATKAVPSELAASRTDDWKEGMANRMVVDGSLLGGDPMGVGPASFRLTYAGWDEAQTSPRFVKDLSGIDPSFGWLVDLTSLAPQKGYGLCYWPGSYRRLLFDSSVVRRVPVTYESSIEGGGPLKKTCSPTLYFMDDIQLYKKWVASL
ncbi:hypothetical protein EON81_09535 [bacterium]|nr:MAG: hypothetical protein EON81_09535 [bacterium]